MATNTNQKVAVLVDIDNAQAYVTHDLLAELLGFRTGPGL